MGEKLDEAVDVGAIDDFQEGSPTLRKHGSLRLVCVRRGGELHVLDDRCPHQGYPLSNGSVSGAILTCEWHNWKFDLGSGECLFGGEPVVRYSTEVVDGRVKVDLRRDAGEDAKRHEASLVAALNEVDLGRAVRDGLRLDALRGTARLSTAFSILARDGAQRAPWGFDHGLAVTADLAAWAADGRVDSAEAFVAAAGAVAEPNAARPKREIAPGATSEGEPMLDPEAAARSIAGHLLAERRADAEVATRFVVRALGPDAAFSALARFVATHLYDYGHGAIFLTKARELARRFPAISEEVFAAACVQLGWATAETKLPPFTTTRKALERLGSSRPKERTVQAFDTKAFEAAVLEGERVAVEAVVALLEEGHSVATLLRAIARAASERLSRFDPAWARRTDADAGVLDVTHLVTFTEAAIAIHRDVPRALAEEIGPSLSIQAAGFVGRLVRGDRTDPVVSVEPATSTSDTFAATVRDHAVPTAFVIATRLARDERSNAFLSLFDHAAFEVAVRPIFVAHAVKVTEALHRLDRDDDTDSDVHLRALAHFLGTPWPESRVRRTAAIAKKFLADAKPPEGLY